MSLLDSFTALVGNAAAKLLPRWVTPFRKPEPNACTTPGQDARAAALEALRDYLAGVDVTYPNGRTGKVAKEDIFITASDDQGGESDIHLPALGVAGGAGEDELPGLGPPDIDDDTWGIAGPGTALAWTGEHRERFTLEVWASDPDERNAVMASLRRALRPSDETGSLVLPLPKYWDQLARFILAGVQVVDDQDAARNRRRVLFLIDLDVAVVELVGAAKMRPKIGVEFEDD